MFTLCTISSVVNVALTGSKQIAMHCSKSMHIYLNGLNGLSGALEVCALYMFIPTISTAKGKGKFVYNTVSNP